MLFPGPTGLQNRIVSHGHCFDFDYRQRRISAAAVWLIFSDAHAGQQLTFDNDLGAGDGFLRDADALNQLHRTLTQRAGDAQLVIAERRGRASKQAPI